jgi:DNA-binding transcriptional LysR family regulator
MRDPQFSELSAFIAVAEEASFTRAAKRVGRSIASLSETVRALEEQLGVRLLNRTTRSVGLTEAGERLVTQLRPLLDAFDEAVEAVNAFRDTPAGHLRLVAPPPVAKFVLAPVLADFLSQYPEISIEISVESATTDIAARHFDAGFRCGDRVARDMVAVRITEDSRFIAAAAPAYLANHGRPVVPSDLQAHNCIRLRFPDGAFFPWTFIVDDKAVEFEVEGSVIVSEPELALNAALEGLGIVYTLDEYVAPMIGDGRLVRVLEESTLPPSGGFFIYYPSRRKNPAALDALIEFLCVNRGNCQRPIRKSA